MTFVSTLKRAATDSSVSPSATVYSAPLPGGMRIERPTSRFSGSVMPFAYARASGETPKKFDMLPSVSAWPIVYSRIGRTSLAMTVTGARPAEIVMPRARDWARGASVVARSVDGVTAGALADAADAATGSDSPRAAPPGFTIQRSPVVAANLRRWRGCRPSLISASWTAISCRERRSLRPVVVAQRWDIRRGDRVAWARAARTDECAVTTAKMRLPNARFL